MTTMTDGLTPEQRTVLRHLECCSDTSLQIATTFNLPIPTVYAALNALERQRLVSHDGKGRWKRSQQ